MNPNPWSVEQLAITLTRNGRMIETQEPVMEQEISAMAERDIEIEDESPYMEIDSGVAMMMV